MSLKGWSRVLARAGVKETEDGFAIRVSPVSLCLSTGHILAAGLCVVLFAMVVWSLAKFPYFSPVSLVEEAAYTYTSANNFLRFGFLNSGFLQDFSTSSDPLDHPYVYNHMPPGPDIFTAIVLRASGRSFRVVRLAYALIFLVGIVFYLKFVQLVLEGYRLKGASYAVLLLGPWMLIQNMERQPYSPFPLLAFAPLVALCAYYRTGRRAYLVLLLVAGFASAVYLEYILLAGVIWCWVFLHLTQLIRVDRRHLLAFLGVVGLGIGLHLLQNFAYLGPSLFFRELSITLGNRMVGSPSQDAVKEFYRSIGLVHHGSHPPTLSALALQFWMLFWFPGRKFLALAAAISLGWVVWRCARYDRAQGVIVLQRGEGTAALAFFGKLALWIGATLTMPFLMFPAFSQEVTLFGSRANVYFLAVGTLALLGFSLRQVVQHPPQLGRIVRDDLTWRGLLSAALWVGSAALWVGLLVGLALSVTSVLKTNIGELRDVRSAFREFRYIQLVDLQKFNGHLYMTNINTPAVGFWTKEAGYGVCGLDSLPKSGDVDPSRCKVALMRRIAYYATQRPRYFFFFADRSLFPGFADCLPSNALPGQEREGSECVGLMYHRLSTRFVRLFENDLFEVYDLEARLRPIGR